jgi:methyl-accepting chemotaxis protein
MDAPALRKPSVVRRNLILSLCFGLGMGLVFPLYASLFVDFKSQTHFTIFVAGCVVAGLVVGLVSFVISKCTVLRSVERVSARLAALDVRSPESLGDFAINSDDAVGRLSRGFQKAISEMQGLTLLLTQAVKGVKEASGEIESGIGGAMAAVNHVGAASTEIRAAVEAQRAETQRMLASFEKLSKDIVLDAANIIELYSYLNAFGSALTDQGRILSELLGMLSTLSGRISGKKAAQGHTVQAPGEFVSHDSLIGAAFLFQKSAESALSTSRKTFDDMRGSLASLSDIAERTSILAINAAIEASRLGTQASGFRVIANSITELAQESKKSVERIDFLLRDGEKALVQSERTGREAAQAHEGLVADISADIAELMRRNDEIDSGSKRLGESQGTNESLLRDIRDSMLDLRQALEANRESLSSIGAKGDAINESTVVLARSAADLHRVDQGIRLCLAAFEGSMAPIDELAATWEAADEEDRGAVDGRRADKPDPA